MNFEQTLARLEQIASSFDRDDLPLEEALRLFEEGVAKLREANTALGEAEAKVQRLIEGASGVFALEEEA